MDARDRDNIALTQEMVKYIPNARLEIFENSGRFVFAEAREKFYRMIKGFTRANFAFAAEDGGSSKPMENL